MSFPNTYTKVNETGCCPVPNIKDWDENEISLNKQTFIRMFTRSFLYVPLNMGKVMTRLQQIASRNNAETPSEQAMILSRDISPWRCEQLYAVTKPIKGEDNVELSGNYLTKVYEGPYKNADTWYKDIKNYTKSLNKEALKIYFFYTTCPKCAKFYGNNYTIALAEV
jgi:hypothetical protein